MAGNDAGCVRYLAELRTIRKSLLYDVEEVVVAAAVIILVVVGGGAVVVVVILVV
jgi:hypothetical protein